MTMQITYKGFLQVEMVLRFLHLLSFDFIFNPIPHKEGKNYPSPPPPVSRKPKFSTKRQTKGPQLINTEPNLVLHIT